MAGVINFKQKGDFRKTLNWMDRVKELFHKGFLDRYGKEGVDALQSATPVDSGLTSKSWKYDIEHTDGRATIVWSNTNVNKGVNIALILDYGHGTGTGGYVAGRHYISPTIQPIFDKIAEEAWNEVTRA